MKMLLPIFLLFATPSAFAAPQSYQGVNWTATTTAPEEQSISHEWKSGGIKVVVDTPRKAAESSSNWMARHKLAVDAALLAFPPDAMFWTGYGSAGSMGVDTLATRWFESTTGARVTVTTKRYAGEPAALWTASHKSAVVAGFNTFP